ncbi:hypothetical protein EL09_15340 [Salmonella enterica subsp. enterica]|nr:hypothetical protein [Salmonella enterica subsp. enterica]MIF51088.1 hypothetical protein [Salmonella enterica subsp. enterica]
MNNDQGTFISVSLDKLRAFDLNPRIIRNPNYDEIKESIRHRGLDQPPQITQRPGESFYIIANGGNTRLAILNELWAETRDKKYFEITCIYHKWRGNNIDEGNLHFLLGHLIENDMRGALTYIERALAIQNISALYSSVHGPLSLQKMARHLREDGYQVSPSELSKMEATVSLLLPHIPEVLYGGLSRNTVEQLLRLRSNTGKYWESHCREMPVDEEKQLPCFDDVFAMALLPFNTPLAGFHVEHIQDELTGLVSQALNVDYNIVALITDAQAQKRNSLLGTLPVPELPSVSEQRRVELPQNRKSTNAAADITDEKDDSNLTQNRGDPPAQDSEIFSDGELDETSVSLPVSVQSANAALGVSRATPPQEDIWHIDPLADSPEALATLIDQTVWELAEAGGLEHLIIPAGFGAFTVSPPPEDLSDEGRVYWQLLAFMAGQLPGNASVWWQMLLGSETAATVFSDDVVRKIVQLVRFIRRFHEKYQGGI